ncbi:hypothetical protein SDC9_163694 [bioreactor metagenome]|uniref:Uncharacterized protein n=1 Tax=bioreactor metagenome TaxID=1076179 RepID=A0A645FPK0_9ZZZZ
MLTGPVAARDEDQDHRVLHRLLRHLFEDRLGHLEHVASAGTGGRLSGRGGSQGGQVNGSGTRKTLISVHGPILPPSNSAHEPLRNLRRGGKIVSWLIHVQANWPIPQT